MAHHVCVRCGGRRIPIPGWPRIHPECLPASAVVWTRKQMADWLAAHEPQNPTRPPTSAVDATKASNR